MNEKTEELQRKLNHVTFDLRDGVNHYLESGNVNSLALGCAYAEFLSILNLIGYENPTLKRENAFKERIQELAEQNRALRKELGLPPEPLKMMFKNEGVTHEF